MTADLKKLSDFLRSDTPEKTLERAIKDRRADLKEGKTIEFRDAPGRVIRISPLESGLSKR